VIELKTAIESHWHHLVGSGELESRRQTISRNRVLTTVNHLIRKRFDEGAEGLVAQLQAVADRTSDPFSAASALLGLKHAEPVR
jgi:LAO/AO transport system kinase